MGTKLRYHVDLDDYVITPNRVIAVGEEIKIYPIKVLSQNLFKEKRFLDISPSISRRKCERVLNRRNADFLIVDVRICVNGICIKLQDVMSGTIASVDLEFCIAHRDLLIEFEVERGDGKRPDYYRIERMKTSDGHPMITERHEHMLRTVNMDNSRNPWSGRQYYAFIEEEQLYA